MVIGANTQNSLSDHTARVMGTPSVEDVVEAREARRYEEYVLDAWSTRREYLTEWHSRLRKLDAFIIGDWSVEMPDGRVVRDRPKIENRVLSKIEDSGTLMGSVVPTIRVEPLHERDVTNAQRRERVLQYYWQNSELELLLPRLFMDMLGTGLCAFLVWPDFGKPLEERFPTFTRLDPRWLLPPLDYIIEGDIEPQDIILHKSVKTRNLAREYPEKASQLMAAAEKISASSYGSRRKGSNIIVDTSQVMVVEYYGRDVVMRLAMVDGYPHTAVPLEQEYNVTGHCPVVLGTRPTADGRIRGKVEAMLPALAAENRLVTYMLDYADQAVYSPLAKRGSVVNAEDYGPNAIIDLGPDGEVKRIDPAKFNPEVMKLREDLEKSSRRGGTLPEARAGDVGQSQGSAAFVESLMGGLTTETQSLQTVVQNMLRRGNVIAQEQDKAWCDTEKAIAGLAKGGSYRERYTPSVLLKDTANFVSYGAGSGLDKFNAEIRLSMREKSGYVSKRWVREQLEGIDNATQEENRILDEAALTATVQAMLTSVGQGDYTLLEAFLKARERNQNPLELIQQIAAAGGLQAMSQQGQPGAGGPQAPMGPQMGDTGIPPAVQANAMQKGGLPGIAPKVPAPPGQLPGGLPPLSQLQIGGGGAARGTITSKQ